MKLLRIILFIINSCKDTIINFHFDILYRWLKSDKVSHEKYPTEPTTGIRRCLLFIISNHSFSPFTMSINDCRLLTVGEHLLTFVPRNNRGITHLLPKVPLNLTEGYWFNNFKIERKQFLPWSMGKKLKW